MPFKLDNYTVRHMGYHIVNFNYTIAGAELAAAKQLRDLGGLILSNLEWDWQVGEYCKKADRNYSYTSRIFPYKSKDIVLPLYKSFGRLRIEYVLQFWSHTWWEI